MRRLSLIFIGLLIFVGIFTATAQEQTPIPIATNTPRVNIPALATNTPRPPTATPRFIAPIDVYALRLWTANDLVQLAADELQTLIDTESDDAALAVRLTMYELSVRFPAALTREAVQEQLLPLHLSAPRGSVDSRLIVRPYIARLISENLSVIDPNRAASYAIGQFRVSVQPVKVSPLSDRDVVLTIIHDESGYTDIVLVRFTDTDAQIIPAEPPYPAAPFRDIEAVELLRVGDINSDGADEIAVGVMRSGAVNDDMRVYAVRQGTAFEVTVPGETIQFAEVVSWDDGTFTVQREREVEGSYWGCVESQPVTWGWGNNLFFPEQTNAPYSATESLACRLDTIGNVFALSPTEALQDMLPLIKNAPESDTLDRAQLTAAMLYALNGQTAEAVRAARPFVDNRPEDDIRHQQALALITRLGDVDSTPLDACAALTPELCDVEAVVMRLLDEPFSTSEPIEVQLATLEIPFEQVVPLQEIGRRERTAVYIPFGVWVAFARGDETYTVERIDAPPQFATPQPPPLAVSRTENIIRRLFTEEDRSNVVTAIDSLGSDLPLELRFIRALANEFAGEREIARRQYYDLWQSDPDGVWGQLASRHLERR